MSGDPAMSASGQGVRDRSRPKADTRVSDVYRLLMPERPITPDETDELRNYAHSGLQLLRVSGTAAPATIVEAIDGFVDQWPRREPALVTAELARSDDIIDLSWALGALWGEQLVREFRWVWTVIGEGHAERYGVVSADRSVALLPSYFVRECLYDATRDFTAMLIFNMLVAGRFNSSPPDDYLDLAETVTRIVPRR